MRHLQTNTQKNTHKLNAKKCTAFFCNAPQEGKCSNYFSAAVLRRGAYAHKKGHLLAQMALQEKKLIRLHDLHTNTFCQALLNTDLRKSSIQLAIGHQGKWLQNQGKQLLRRAFQTEVSSGIRVIF